MGRKEGGKSADRIDLPPIEQHRKRIGQQENKGRNKAQLQSLKKTAQLRQTAARQSALPDGLITTVALLLLLVLAAILYFWLNHASD